MIRLAPAFALLILALPGRGPIRAQKAAPSASEAELASTVRALDTKLFDAYNRCDLATLGSLVSDDLEFYHDQTGLAVGKAPFLKATQQNICGKVHRELLPDTLEVYPLNHYGAVEIGVHRFSHPDRPGQDIGDAKFVMLWQQRPDGWVLTRVISYEHNHGLLAK